MKLPVNHALSLAALMLLGAGGAGARDREARLSAPPVTGPAADYPVVVGEPFTIGSTVWTPIDQLNYDAVGFASIGEAGLVGVTGAHKTLPLPSYVEVTALDTGKTILVRLERRGPMFNDTLIELSSAAATQLGLVPGGRSPVRVRRVNPPEQERAILRAGDRAPERMETPDGLLKVLRRKLADQSPLQPPPSMPPSMPAGTPASPIAKPAPKPVEIAPNSPGRAPAPSPVAAPTPAVSSRKPLTPSIAAAPVPKGAFFVQVAAFSVEANARKVAAQLNGGISRAGKLWRVRLGPFANRAKAAPALEKARNAGYRDARIQPAD
ncbi:rare lipoprotein A [Novosphingobium sp. CF614]|uniref:SPOR domain-containing protein n=1 Tax=Novosphingobium sp. CF614 TaxID=1884364 RepID=UPI0008E373AC|nr:SPOR domain-containing protein [Novosphingobium sp. CF614]SFG03409.1 rare lipoprotein A [Novosphingobium sp. CF614]